jgi:hypothetical protein
MKRVLQFAIAAIMLFAACSKEDETPPPLTQEQHGAAVVEGTIDNETLPPATVHANASKYKVSEDEAVRNLNAFLSTLEGDGLSKSGNQVRIAGISAFRTKGSNSISKSLNTEEEYVSVDVDTLMYAVNFADSMGFALMSADRRTAPIFAIADQGNIDFENITEEENEGLLIFLDGAIGKAVDDIASYTDDNTVSLSKSGEWYGSWNIKYMTPVYLQTRWGQDYPYNYYCDDYYAGCVIIATAQILSYYQTVRGYVSWFDDGKGATAYLDWSQIISDCKENGGTLNMSTTYNSALSVACLCRKLGVDLDAEYDDDGTSAKSSDAIKWLNVQGRLNATDLDDYDKSKIMSALNDKKIVYARGYRNKKKHWIRKTEYKNGHAWVIDGYVSAVKGTKTYTLVHCNWGWNGTANGYYLSDSFDVYAGPEIADSYGYSNVSDEWYYQYKLQYSIISK